MKICNSIARNLRSCYMFFLLLCIGLLFSTCSSSSPGEEVGPPLILDPIDAKAVLFVGNSLTNNNSMTEMVRRMAATTERALLYTQHAPGGATIADHVTSGELETKIASRQWDFVSIQAQSLELAAASESTLSNTLHPNITTLVDKVRANNSASIPIFYMNWGFEDVNESHCRTFPDDCTFEGMNDLIKERYLTVMALNDGQVSPGAELWGVIRERHPELQLYAFDGLHPSVLGSYVIALSYYTMIFEADPTLTAYHRNELDATDEALLREIVKEVVFDRISEWRAN